jgi:hypothetical protein
MAEAPEPPESQEPSVKLSVTNMDGLVEVPEDIYDTEGVFNEIISRATLYDIITVIEPPIKYSELIRTTKPGKEQLVSFEGALTGGKNKKTMKKQNKKPIMKQNKKTMKKQNKKTMKKHITKKL